MNFKLDSEQQMLQDSVLRFITKAYTMDARAVQVAAHDDTAQWRAFADNGWLAAALPDDAGGLGGSIIDTALIAHEFGRGLVIEPYLGCAVLAAQTLLAAASDAQKACLLPALAQGDERFALAWSEPGARGNPAFVLLRAQQDENGYRLDGRKSLVLGGAGADRLLVSAQLADTPGVSLFLVDADAPGVSMETLRLHDGSLAADVTFDAAHVGHDALVGVAGQGLAALRTGIAHAVAALCAELVGAMERAIEITADYLKIRKQFGVAISSFQALQHRMADMAADMELSRSMLHVLLASIENDMPAARTQTVAQAKALIGRLAKRVCGQAIQLHGGIGMTEECAIGHFFKRAVVADVLFGSSDQHDAASAAMTRAALMEACPGA